jgi:hypothetical protein
MIDRWHSGHNPLVRLSHKFLLVAMTAAFALAPGDALAAPFAGDICTAWFVTPLPNASFEGAPVSFDAEIDVHQGLDDGPLTTIEVFVNGESIGTQDCPTGCTFPDIELDKGIHQLSLLANTGYSGEITVYVDEEVPPDTTDTGTDTGSDDGTDEASGSDDFGDGGGGGGGGGCTVQDRQPAPWALLTLPLFLLVPSFRRRH